MSLANAAITSLPGGGKVFAGQRAEGFYVDLGSIFDLAALRPIESLHLIPIPGSAAAVNATKDLNVHSIALQVPIASVTANGEKPSDPLGDNTVLGVWTTASRQRVEFNEPANRKSPHDARAVDAGLTSRQSALQRSARPDGTQGRMES